MTNFWNVRHSPEEHQRVQDGYNDTVGRMSREHAHEQARRKTLSDRDNLIAAMAGMLVAEQRNRPDVWSVYEVDNDALASVIADWLLARRR